MNSPLQLNAMAFTDVRITSVPDANVESTLETVVEYKTSINDANKRHWMVAVRVYLRPVGDSKVPYIGTVECVGFFTVDSDWPEDQVQKLVVVNGSSVLYSAIREMICNITSRGPFFATLILSQSFAKSYEESKGG